MARGASQSLARRVDAERNRDKILAAARAAFADPEADVSMAEVARRAGVGMATLYRNFPARRDLLEALFANEVGDICGAAAARIRGDAPGEVLRAWLKQFFAFATTKHHIASDLLAQSDRNNPIFGESRERVLAAGRPLLAAAQRSHDVRRNLTLEQILDMLLALSKIPGDARYGEPILQIALDGLRPRPK